MLFLFYNYQNILYFYDIDLNIFRKTKNNFLYFIENYNRYIQFVFIN